MTPYQIGAAVRKATGTHRQTSQTPTTMSTKTTIRKPRNGEYEIYQEVGGEHVRTMLTGSRAKAVAEVERLLALGVSQYDIYATYCGKNFGQASTHLLLPSQRA